MSAAELLAGMVDEVPPAVVVVPVAFVEDPLLPAGLAPVEPVAFALECAFALWGPRGPLN